MKKHIAPLGSTRTALVVVALSSVWCAQAHSQALLPFDATPERTGLTYSAGISASSDNNFLRLPDGVKPSDRSAALGDQRSDVTFSPYLDATARINVSRQRFIVDLNVRNNRYRTYDRFNSTLVNGSGSWLWQLGNDFDGELTYSRVESQTAIANQSQSLSALTAGLNQLQTDMVSAKANYRPRPDRRLTLLGSESRSTNSSPTLRFNDNRITTVGAQAGYVSGRSDEIYGYAQVVEGNYPNRVTVITAPIDNSFRQHEYGVGLTWRPGGFTEAQGKFGWARRSHDDVPERNFWGPVSSLNLRYQLTGKLAAELGARREIGSTDAFDSVYTLISGFTGRLTYVVTPKVSANINGKWQRDDYRGDPNSIQSNLSTRPKRLDNSSDGGFGIDWLPYDRWSVGLDVARVRRSSNLLGSDNRPLYDYKANVVTVTTQYRFR